MTHDPRKRLHPIEGRPFKRGDIREDGCIFNTYAKTKIRETGYYAEQWLSPDAFARFKESSREAINKWYKEQVSKRRLLIDKIKLDSGCSLCGYNAHAVALDFDHLNPKEKEFTIGTKYCHKPWIEILKEIQKCRVLCANCHRVETLLAQKQQKQQGK